MPSPSSARRTSLFAYVPEGSTVGRHRTTSTQSSTRDVSGFRKKIKVHKSTKVVCFSFFFTMLRHLNVVSVRQNRPAADTKQQEDTNQTQGVPGRLDWERSHPWRNQEETLKVKPGDEGAGVPGGGSRFMTSPRRANTSGSCSIWTRSSVLPPLPGRRSGPGVRRERLACYLLLVPLCMAATSRPADRLQGTNALRRQGGTYGVVMFWCVCVMVCLCV